MKVLNEIEIVEEIKKRIKELQDDRNYFSTMNGGKDGWVAWGDSDEGYELESLQKMLKASDSYIPEIFDGLLY